MSSAKHTCIVLAAVLCMAVGAASAAPSPRAALSRTLPSVDFTNVTLADALDFLRDLTGVNLHVNWKALEAAGIGRETPINLKLRSVPLRQVLSLVLSEAAGSSDLTYYIDDGIIEITTKEQADNQMFTVVYPVQDLLAEPPDTDTPPSFVLSDGYSGQGGGSRSSGGRNGGSRSNSRYGGNSSSGNMTGGLFGPSSGTTGSGNSGNKVDKGKELIDLIVETVSPNVWVQNGGKASIRFFNGNLIITAPRSVHEAIGGPID